MKKLAKMGTGGKVILGINICLIISVVSIIAYINFF